MSPLLAVKGSIVKESPEAARRRVPSQQRSRARVEQVLDIATALIAKHGSEKLFEVFARLHPAKDRDELFLLAALLMQQIASAVRLAISLDRSHGDVLIEMFKRLIPSDPSKAL
jgi:hypothetical protein